MLGPTTMTIGAGPLYTNAVMGQAPSAAERENVRKVTSNILRRQDIHIEESESLSRPESPWSMHFSCTNQAPYSGQEEGEMITQTSFLHLPKANPSHDLAFFLRTTGPTASHRRPSKLDRRRRGPPGPKNALRFLGFRQRRPQTSFAAFDDCEFQDEGGLLVETAQPSNPKTVKQKVSAEGTKYLALQVNEDPSILDSQVTVSVVDGRSERESMDDRHALRKDKISRRVPTPGAQRTYDLSFDDEATITIDSWSSSGPVRPAASNPPTPGAQSAISTSVSVSSEMIEQSLQSSSNHNKPTSNHPIHVRRSASLPPPDVWLAYDQLTPKAAIEATYTEIQQPSPRRLASHPVLSQRASSIASAFTSRGFSGNPGPPPKSPLRLRREPREIEEILTLDADRKSTPKVAPSIKAVSDYNIDAQIIKPTVVTDCTGPIKRPRSRGKKQRTAAVFLTSRKDREERIRARKLRDRPLTMRTIDAIVSAAPSPPRQRLKKARPQIQTQDLQHAPQATRASSTTSSNASWKKVTDFPRTSVSTAPCEGLTNNNGNAFQMPTSPAASDGSGVESIALSSVMLVAEEIPLAKAKAMPKSSKSVVKDNKPYVPRPRSASIPRNSAQRRSRQAARTPSRPSTPNGGECRNEEAPPLPSPPPTRALPLPPLVPEPDQEKQPSPIESKNKRPFSPIHDIGWNAGGLKPVGRLPHVATQTQRKRLLPREFNATSDVNARLEALEKHNALLSAALTAVLRTNGALNSPLPPDVERVRTPMVWENRIARRSAASHGGSSSKGSALEMYMSTRHGS